MISDIVLIQFRLDQKMAMHELNCIARDLNISKSSITVYNAIKQDLSSINPTDFSALIFGGSGDISVSDDNEIIKLVKNNIKILLAKIIDNDTPSLFICLGYHLLSDYLGEFVKNIPNQAESGSSKIYLTTDGQADAIFAGLPKQLIVQQAHNDSIESLPKGAILLASNKRCPIQAYKVNKYIYALQFHPELQREDMLIRLTHYSDKYQTDKSNFKESSAAAKILQNFIKIVHHKNIKLYKKNN